MKYILVIGDGMADFPVEALGGRTPLEAAQKPTIDGLARRGIVSEVKTVPDGVPPAATRPFSPSSATTRARSTRAARPWRRRAPASRCSRATSPSAATWPR